MCLQSTQRETCLIRHVAGVKCNGRIHKLLDDTQHKIRIYNYGDRSHRDTDYTETQIMQVLD